MRGSRSFGLEGLALSALFACGACGSSGGGASTPASTSPVNNVVPVVVDGGPVPGQIQSNILYASVTLCAPGSQSNCQTIDSIQVDTGSSGLRILASALTLALPSATGPSGKPLAECLQFSNSSTWGSVRTADVQLGGERANGAAVQIIGDPAYPKVPSACTNGGFPSNDTLATLGANGLIGVGNLVQDCGVACAIGGVSNPGLYYECSSPTNCQVAAVVITQQVQNPVALFAADNNGVLIQLPSVAVSAAQLNGSLIFGIGTQDNNALGTATTYTFNQDGFLGTTFNGQSLPFSFIDSGSNFLSFPDSKIPTCKDFQNAFYCPTKSLNLSATIHGLNGSAGAVPFTVDNADTVSNAHPNDAAFSTIDATTVLAQGNAQNGPKSFDWGLPFYYGRNVFTAIEGRSTPNGNGPYVAF